MNFDEERAKYWYSSTMINILEFWRRKCKPILVQNLFQVEFSSLQESRIRLVFTDIAQTVLSGEIKERYINNRRQFFRHVSQTLQGWNVLPSARTQKAADSCLFKPESCSLNKVGSAFFPGQILPQKNSRMDCMTISSQYFNTFRGGGCMYASFWRQLRFFLGSWYVDVYVLGKVDNDECFCRLLNFQDISEVRNIKKRFNISFTWQVNWSCS